MSQKILIVDADMLSGMAQRILRVSYEEAELRMIVAAQQVGASVKFVRQADEPIAARIHDEFLCHWLERGKESSLAKLVQDFPSHKPKLDRPYQPDYQRHRPKFRSRFGSKNLY